MDLISLIIYIILIYIVYILVSTISSLREEIREMRLKCIKGVYKNKPDVLEKSTDDPKKILGDTLNSFIKYIRN